MVRFKLPTLALAAAGLAATSAHATVLQGGGSTILAPYWAQATGCWAPGVIGDPANNGSYIEGGSIFTPPPLSPPCLPTASDSIEYVAVGAGVGQAALFAHDGPIFLPDNVTLFFGTRPGGFTLPVFTSGGIQYGLSDNALVDNDVGVYSVGTGASYTTPGGSVITTVATYQGLTFGAGKNYPAAKPLYGPLVQFPVAVVPIAIAYNPSYDGVHILQFGPGITTLKLDKTAYCGIFAHTITDWNDPVLTALNGGSSLTGGVSAAIHLVGDISSSGATSIFTRHLSAICGNTALWTTAGTTTLPASLQPFYSLAVHDRGIAAQLHAQPGSIGYIGPDYVLPAVANTGLNTFNLPAALLKNNAGNFRTINSPNALASAFGSVLPPSGAARTNPLNWVQSTANTVALANPTGAQAYPIVGTTNFIGYTCYSTQAKVDELNSFLNFGGALKAGSILSASGLLTVPGTWPVAIAWTFLGSGDGQNLEFARAGAGSPNPNCTAPGIIGG